MKIEELAALFDLTPNALIDKAKEFGVDLSPRGDGEVDEEIVQALRQALGDLVGEPVVEEPVVDVNSTAAAPSQGETSVEDDEPTVESSAEASSETSVPAKDEEKPPASMENNAPKADEEEEAVRVESAERAALVDVPDETVPVQENPSQEETGKSAEESEPLPEDVQKKFEQAKKAEETKEQDVENVTEEVEAAAKLKVNPLGKIQSLFAQLFFSLFKNKAYLGLLLTGAFISAAVAFSLSSFLVSSQNASSRASAPEQVAPPVKPLPPVHIEGGLRGEEEVFQIIWELAAQGYSQQAYDYAKRFLEDFPESEHVADVYFKLGDIQFEWKRGAPTQQYKEARIAYQQAIELYPNDSKVPWAMYQVGNTFFKVSLYEDAVKAYRKVIERFPAYKDLDRARYKLGLALLLMGDYERSRLEFKWLIDTFPNSVFVNNAYLRIAETFYRQKNYEGAIESYLHYIDRYPESPKMREVYFRIAKLSQTQGNLDAAIIYYKKSIGKYPDDHYNELADYNIGNCWYQLGNFEKAREVFKSLQDLYPGSVVEGMAAFRIGDAYLKEENLEKAIETYEKAMDKYPNVAGAKASQIRLGELYFKSGVYDKMITLYSSMIISDPNYFGNDRLVLRIAQAYFNNGDYLNAAEWFLDLIENYPASDLARMAYFGKAKSEEEALYFDQAIRSYEQFLLSYPDHPRADLVLFQIGNMYFEMGRYQDAIDTYETLRAKYAISDYRYFALMKIGTAYAEIANSETLLTEWAQKRGLEGNIENLKKELQQKSDEAFSDIVTNKALEGSDEFFDASLSLATAYQKEDKPEIGLQILEKALSIYASQTRAYKLLKLKGELSYELNLLDQTIHTYEDLISLLSSALENKDEDAAQEQAYLSAISEAYMALGDMLYAQDNFGQALYLYLEGISRMPKSDRRPWPFYQVANCYNRLNNYEKANFYYEKVKEEFPDNFWSEYIGWNQDRMQWEQNLKRS